MICTDRLMLLDTPPKKSRTAWGDHYDDHTRQSGFPFFRIRDFLPLRLRRFGFVTNKK
jgi:hypothetical protein